MKKVFLLSFALLSLLFTSCHEEKNARIEVWLTDDPGDYQQVNIDLQAVEIHADETADQRGWQSLDVTPRIYNLLNLTNGRETFLGDLDLPSGRISQIRLKLGENNTVKVNGSAHPLNTPSAQQSGLKLQVHQVLAEGITYKILLDFDAAKSVVVTGANSYILKPVIRAITEAQNGAIKGTVNPAGIVSISAVKGSETITTTASDESGNFLVRGLDAGSYTIVFDPSGDAPDVEKTDVAVTVGEVTDLGVVEIPE
jgi:hypothetical protein